MHTENAIIVLISIQVQVKDSGKVGLEDADLLVHRWKKVVPGKCFQKFLSQN